jgi:hypothetical protein
MDTLIGFLGVFSGAIIGGLLYGDAGAFIGLFIGGYIGIKLGNHITKEDNKRRKISYSTKSRGNNTSSIKKGYGKIITHVVGVSFNDRQKIINNLEQSDRLYLVREPNNVHDENAIQVLIPRKKDGVIVYSEDYVSGISTATGIPIQEYYVMDDVGYINQELAEKIAPFFDKYAWGPNRFIRASIKSFNKGPNKPTGVQIEFNIPTAGDLEDSKIKSMYGPRLG